LPYAPIVQKVEKSVVQEPPTSAPTPSTSLVLDSSNKAIGIASPLLPPVPGAKKTTVTTTTASPSSPAAITWAKYNHTNASVVVSGFVTVQFPKTVSQCSKAVSGALRASLTVAISGVTASVHQVAEVLASKLTGCGKNGIGTTGRTQFDWVASARNELEAAQLAADVEARARFFMSTFASSMKESFGISITVLRVGPAKVKYPKGATGRILGTMMMTFPKANTSQPCSRTAALKGALAAALTSTSSVKVLPKQVTRFVLSGCTAGALQGGYKRMLVWTVTLDTVAKAKTMSDKITVGQSQFISEFISSFNVLTTLSLTDVTFGKPLFEKGKQDLFAA